jgi:hypothetical protein
MTRDEAIFTLGGILALAGHSGATITVRELAKAIGDATPAGVSPKKTVLGGALLGGSMGLTSYEDRITESLDKMLGKRYGDFVLTAEGEGSARKYSVSFAV